MTEFIEIAYVGLPLAGKTTSIAQLAGTKSTSVVLSRANYAAREIMAIIPGFGAAGQTVVLRTYCGAVWSAAVWELQVAGADGVIVVLDPQLSRAEDQAAFLDRLHRVIHRSCFDPSKYPIAFQVNKADLVPKPDPAKLIGKLWDGSERTFQSCALEGLGLTEPVKCCLSQVTATASKLVDGIPRAIGVRPEK